MLNIQQNSNHYKDNIIEIVVTLYERGLHVHMLHQSVIHDGKQPRGNGGIQIVLLITTCINHL